MKQSPMFGNSFDDALVLASNKTSISKLEWISKGNIMKLIRQKTIADFF